MQHFGFANGFDCEDGEDCKCYKSFNQTGTNNDKVEWVSDLNLRTKIQHSFA
jgi:hypothetical protein